MFMCVWLEVWFFFSSRRRHTRSTRDWSSDVCSSDLVAGGLTRRNHEGTKGMKRPPSDDFEARLLANEIAIDALLAEIEELQNRLEAHARVCPGEIEIV